MKRTTDIDEIVNGAPFTWGHVVTVYTVGPYQIAEYHPWARNGTTVKVGKVNRSKILFHCWVDGKDTSHSCASLDEAMAECIAYAAEGPNSRASKYFIRMIKDR